MVKYSFHIVNVRIYVLLLQATNKAIRLTNALNATIAVAIMNFQSTGGG